MTTRILTREQVLSYFPEREVKSHKGMFGRLTIFGSSREYVGAIKLATLGSVSMRMGTGYTVLAVNKSLFNTISPEVFECVLCLQEEVDGAFKFDICAVKKAIENADAVIIGMGMGKSEEVRKLINYLFSNYTKKVLIDADGLNSMLLSDLKYERTCELVLTPHKKEFSRLFEIPIEKVIACGEQLSVSMAKELKLVLHLKGHQSFTTDGKQSYRVGISSPALAKAGSGDYLSGAIGGLMTRLDTLSATAVAAEIIGNVAMSLAKSYNDNVLLARDIDIGVKEFFFKVK